MSLPLVGPFRALRPAPGREADVAAPPYDVLSAEEAQARAQGRRWSFLHVSRPEIDLPPGTDPYSAEVYAKGAESLARMIAEGILIRDPVPRYYVYRLDAGDHTQTGIAGAGSIAAYESGRIRKHELTQPRKENDRVRQIDAVNAQTGPVFVTHRANREVAAVAEHASSEPPSTDVVDDDGVRHRVWPVADAEEIERIRRAFEDMDAIYIADGHHRSAAAARVARQRRDANPSHQGDEAYNTLLLVSFADDEVRILDYNRVVRDLAGATADAVLARLDGAFTVEPRRARVRPMRARSFGMYLEGRWYRLTLREQTPAATSAVDRLDVNLLTRWLLEPVLGIGDPRTDPRIGFVGGSRGLEELERHVDGGEMAVAFSLFPTALADLIAVADAGHVMPPKSTWFEPKLADGLVSLVLD